MVFNSYFGKLREYVGRSFDLVFASSVLFFLSPILLVLCILIRLSSRGPVFYKQERIGQYGKYFPLLKFRTMIPNADEYLGAILMENKELEFEYEKLHKLKADPRITPVGRFLRRTSLDELPQFINVIRGEMSVIGPRPIVDEETPKYGQYLEEFLSVRPGITGLWQVWGRSDTTYEERVFMDIFYIRNKSLLLRAYILMATIGVVLKQKGAY